VAQGPQKPDHGGNFFMTPRRVTNSVAWRRTSFRARAALQVFQDRHDGFNNGRIALGTHDVAHALGDRNYGAASRAIAELIEKGFLECMSDADRRHSKVREYRITFIATGKGKDVAKATHDYEAWRPTCKNRKFGSAKTAPQDAVCGAKTAPMMQLSGANIALDATVSRGVASSFVGASSALLIDNHSKPTSEGEEITSPDLTKSRAADLRLDVTDLRAWSQAVVDRLGYGGARCLALNAGVPEPVLSRFRKGRNLPDRFRLPLQEACGRHLPFRQWAETLREVAA